MLWHDRDELLSQISARLGQEVVAVNELFGLVLDLSDVLGMGVAAVGDEDAAGPVEELVAINVPDVDAASAVPHQRDLIAH